MGRTTLVTKHTAVFSQGPLIPMEGGGLHSAGLRGCVCVCVDLGVCGCGLPLATFVPGARKK